MDLDLGLDPELRSKTANYHMLLGRVRKAVSIRQSNQLIDPIQRNDPFGIYDRLMLGEFQDAINHFTRLEQRDPQSVRGFVPHGFWSHNLLGKEAEALQFARQRGWPQLAESFLATKNDETLLTLSPAQLRSWAEQRYGRGAEFDFAYAGLNASHFGHPTLAVQFMRLAFEEPSGGALFTLWHPAMARARKTAAFEQLVTDLGLVKAWRKSGDWGDFCRPVSKTKITCT
jgi:hypothetical protein